jgi:hypothetical protein
MNVTDWISGRCSCCQEFKRVFLPRGILGQKFDQLCGKCYHVIAEQHEKNEEPKDESPTHSDQSHLWRPGRSTIQVNPHALGTNQRALGTNPNALGTNPRASGTNPRALGMNPRANQSAAPRRAASNRDDANHTVGTNGPFLYLYCCQRFGGELASPLNYSRCYVCSGALTVERIYS